MTRGSASAPTPGLSALLTGAALLGLAGCASSLTGIGGTEQYGCRAPAGSQCLSVSGVYGNAGQGARQMLGRTTAIQDQPPTPRHAQAALAHTPAPIATVPIQATAPLRSAPRVLRLWIAPWEDSDGDLHEASTVNVLIDHGRWLLERVRPAPRSPFLGVAPPAATTSATAPTPPPATTGAELSPVSAPRIRVPLE